MSKQGQAPTLNTRLDGADLSTPLVLECPTTPHTTVPVAWSGSAKKEAGQRSPFASTLVQKGLAASMSHAGSGYSFRLLWCSWAAPLACIAWLLVSSTAILVNKHILVDLDFPFPCTVAALGVTGTSIISNIAVRLVLLHKSQRVGPSFSNTGLAAATESRVSWRFYCTYIAPAGLLLALGLHMGNTAYLYLSVAYIQMLKAFTPVVTMLFAFAFRLERPTLLLTTAVCLIAGGVAVASLGEGALSMTGLAAMLASSTCEALRLVLMQAIMARKSMHPLQTLAYVYPAAWVWMVALAGATEALNIHQQQAWLEILQHPGALLASTAAGFGANAAALLVVSLTGALTLKCLGLAKDVGLVVYGVARLGEAVSVLQGCGFTISLLGFVAYNAAKTWAAQHAASKLGYSKLPDGASCSSNNSSSSGRGHASKAGAAAARRIAPLPGVPMQAAVGAATSTVVAVAAAAAASKEDPSSTQAAVVSAAAGAAAAVPMPAPPAHASGPMPAPASAPPDVAAAAAAGPASEAAAVHAGQLPWLLPQGPTAAATQSSPMQEAAAAAPAP